MPEGEAAEIIATIRLEVEQAADLMLSATERGLRNVTAARGGDASALDDIERIFCAIMEACAFQDLTGQRLSKLEGMIDPAAASGAGADPLLNGPAPTGEGLDQTAADELFAAAAP